MRAVDNFAQEIKKPIEAIQCKNTFSLLQRKMYNVLLANAIGNLRADVTHRIQMGVLCKFMGYASRDYDTIKNRFRELRRMEIEWDIINEKGNNVWTTTSPLSLARVIEGEGICEYEFANGLIPYLDRPAQYAKFSLVIQSKFKSSYGLALYENCERYRKIGCTKSFEISTFRKLMGVKENEYPEFFALKRRVIDKAVKEVNQYATFDIEPEYEKVGKQTTKIKFRIKVKNIEIEAANELKENDESELTTLLKQVFDLSDKEITKLFNKFGINYINEKVAYVLNTSAYKNGTINNVGGYLTTTINNDYKIAKSSTHALQQSRQIAFEENERKRKIEALTQDAERGYSLYLKKIIFEAIDSLSSEDKQLFKDSFGKYLEEQHPYSFSEFQKKGMLPVMVSCHLRTYVENNYPKFLFDILTYEDYIQKFCLDLHLLLFADKS